MQTLFKPQEIKEKTNLSCEQIIEIAIDYIQKQEIEYEINSNHILYDVCFYISQKPVWYIDVIALLNKQRFPDDYETLVISDEEEKVICVINEHGRVIKKYF